MSENERPSASARSARYQRGFDEAWGGVQNPPPLTLTEFLLARIAEDEAQATDRDHTPLRCGIDRVTGLTLADRMLAECKAKRGVVILSAIDDWDGGYGEPMHIALKLAATPYASHPDYRQEWKP